MCASAACRVCSSVPPKVVLALLCGGIPIPSIADKSSSASQSQRLSTAVREGLLADHSDGTGSVLPPSFEALALFGAAPSFF